MSNPDSHTRLLHHDYGRVIAMPEIIPDILKSRIGREEQYPLNYTDLEACFKEWDMDVLFLQVYFSDFDVHSVSRRKERAAKGRYELARVVFSTEAPVTTYGQPPWHDVERPQVVRSSVNAIERRILHAAGLRRSLLAGLLAEHVSTLRPGKGASAHRFSTIVSLLTAEKAVEFQWNCTRGNQKQQTGKHYHQLHQDNDGGDE
jgi:hypothetical protein